MAQRANGLARLLLALALALVAAMAAPAAAAAADTYADAATGSDLNDCLTPETACLTVAAALSKSGPGDTTFVADGLYPESVTVGQGKSLQALDGSLPRPQIDNGIASSPAITVDATGAGTVSGFGVRSDHLGVLVNGDVILEDNDFNENVVQADSQSQVRIAGGTAVELRDNAFIDPDASGVQYGVVVGSGTPLIADSSFDDLVVGVVVREGVPTIARNSFRGPVVSSPTAFVPAGGNTAGVFVDATAASAPTGAALSRNRISDTSVGVQVTDSDAPVTLSNDLIYASDTGIEALDTSADVPPSTQGDVSAENVTLSNGVDVRLDHTTLTIDSSILSSGVQPVGGNGSCTITYSRGPSAPAPNGCDDYVTSAPPNFVSPLAGDYHLQGTSAMIDAGNPADPVATVDFYGDPRVVQGAACRAVRRDIGATEYQPASQPLCAQTTYADVAAGDDNADCASPATACETIAAALAKSAPGQATLLADGTYSESVLVQGGRRLGPLDGTGPRPLIDNGDAAAAPAVTLDEGRVNGLRIHSGFLPMLVQDGPAEVDGNVFDDAGAPGELNHLAVAGGTGVSIHDNAFSDPDASGAQAGIGVVDNSAQASISSNTFADLAVGVLVVAGSAQVSGNQFSGARPIGAALPGTPGAGVMVLEGGATVTANTIADPGLAPSAGVYVSESAPTDPATAALARNLITGQDTGVQVVDAGAAVTLSSDLIHGNTTGLQATDSSADTPDPSDQGDVAATNATLWGNGTDVRLEHTYLTLDSSIVEDPIELAGGGSCTIIFSRGPADPVAGGCDAFATDADPQFVDAAAGDFHLQATSALINIGNSADPGAGALDFYGAPRALATAQCVAPRRDIGAAEFQPVPAPVCPTAGGASATGTAAPAPAPAATPSVVLGSRPKARSSKRKATFKFSSDAPVTFRCRMDRAAWKSCAPPVTFRGLRYGKHRFQIYAVAGSGARSATVTYRFKVIKRKR